MGILDAPTKVFRPQSIVLLGDSLTEQGGELPVGDAYGVANGAPGAPRSRPYTAGNSAWTWGNALLGQAFQVLANLGIGGQTTTQIRSRLRDAVSFNPGWVHLLAGTNDMGSGTTTAIANISAMLDSLAAAKIRVILGTIPPRTGSAYTGTQKADTLILNEWIRQQARSRAGIIVVDYYAALAGPGSNYAPTILGRNPTVDGVHLSATGGYVCGKVLASAVGRFVSPAVPYSEPAPGNNLLSNPRPGNALTGTAPPSGFTVAGSSAAAATWADAPRDDGLGTWKQVTVPADGVLVLQSNFTLDSSRLSVGDYVVAVAELDISNLQTSAAAAGMALAVKAWNGSSFASSMYAMQDTAPPMEARRVILRTPAWQIPTGTTIAALFIEVSGGMALKFDRVGLYNVRDYPADIVRTA